MREPSARLPLPSAPSSMLRPGRWLMLVVSEEASRTEPPSRRPRGCRRDRGERAHTGPGGGGPACPGCGGRNSSSGFTWGASRAVRIGVGVTQRAQLGKEGSTLPPALLWEPLSLVFLLSMKGEVGYVRGLISPGAQRKLLDDKKGTTLQAPPENRPQRPGCGARVTATSTTATAPAARTGGCSGRVSGV